MASIAAIINTDQAPLDPSLLRALMGPPPSRSGEARLRIDGYAGLATFGQLAVSPDSCLIAGRDVWAVLDGRLDDRDTLIAELGTAGGDAEDMSDAAVLVRAYETWGDDCVSHLLGDFSFCLWDNRNRHLLCARDHFGVKPLYYARAGRALVVSSALRWLRRHPAISRRLRHEAIGDFLLFGVCADQAHTAFVDIYRVPPAHCLSCSGALDSPRLRRYWVLHTGDPVGVADPREYVDRFSHWLRVAVADRVRSGPVGVLMSGGLDSSSVAAVAARLLDGAAADRLQAFTIVHDTLTTDEEGRYSSVVARSLGIPLVHISVDQYQPFDRWDGDSLPPEPSLEGLTAVMLDVLDLIARHSGAVLTGDGGDPLLLPTSVSDLVGRVPASAVVAGICRSWRLGLRPPFGIRSRVARWLSQPSSVPSWLGSDLLNAFDAHARWQEIQARGRADRTARCSAVNEVNHPWWSSTFESFDPGVTQRPVELRYPFFDVRLASFVLRLPSLPWCLNKHVLREATRGWLPESVRLRSKTPLAGNPGGTAGRWSSQRALALFDATPEIAGFVDVGKFRTAVESDSLLSNESVSEWAAISLAMWLRCDAATSAACGAR